MNENRNTIKDEINLTDVLLYCLMKWRWIVIVMLIIALLFGGYKFSAVRKNNRVALQQWNQIGIEEEGDFSAGGLDVLMYYQSLLEQCTKTLQKQKDYMDNSAVMQMDAYHIQNGTLNYVLMAGDVDQSYSLQKLLIAAYKAYTTDGRLAELLYSEERDIALADSMNLLTFSELTTEPMLDINGMTIDVGQYAVFQIQINSSDMESCEKYLKVANQAIQSYSAELQEQVGRHELTLLSSNVSESRNQKIQDYQRTVLDSYTTIVRSLNIIQTEAKTLADSIEKDESVSDGLVQPTLLSPVRSAFKFAILGMLLGAFLTGSAIFIIYIIDGRLHSIDNFETRYDMRILGHIIEPVKSKGIFRVLDRQLQRIREGAYATLSHEEQIKIVSANIRTAVSTNVEKAHIMLAGTMAARDVVSVCEAVAKEMEGTFFSSYRQLIFDASALEELDDYDGILFIEKRDISSSRLIWQEAKMAKDRNAKILGTIVI